MNIIIPMAGLGSRFKNSGFIHPKPLIKVGNKPMYRYAVESLPLHLATQLIFIMKESEYSSELSKDIINVYQRTMPCKIILLKEETRGQAETILKSEHEMDDRVPTLIHNCDTYFQTDFDWTELLSEESDGGLVLFTSNEPRWSYARLDPLNRRVVEVKEKQVISNHASTGTYYFKNTPLLFDNIKKMIREDIRQNDEYYLSTVYGFMLEKNLDILPIWTKVMLCFGTPQDLVNSLNEMIMG